MQTNRKSLGIIIIVLGLIILGLIIYFGFFYGNEKPQPIVSVEQPAVTAQLPSIVEETPTTTPGDRNRNYQLYDTSKEAEHKINQNDLVKLAELVAQRIGSFSNYSNYSNFTDLNLFMTDNMKTWADKYVADLKAATKAGEEYYGITTKAIVSKVVEYNDTAGKAKIVVTTQRRESTGQTEGKAYNQDIEITLQKVNGDWLVDQAYWVK
ncbi:MAG: hypothetical protein WCT50_03890 [Patescibacteria group bacterium]